MRLTEQFAAGRPAFGVTLTIADPFVAEVIAAQSFDFLMVDTEHSPISTYQLQTQLIALRSSAASILVRVPHNEATAIMTVLDLGADGVVVPQVQTGDECARAVSAARYPPRGTRGVGPRRAARLTDRDGYFRRANDETLVVIMIESGEGVENLAKILSVDGVGGVIIGVADLSASLGHLDNPGHADVLAAVDTIQASCLANGIPFGMYAASAAAANELVGRGARIITVGSDLLFLEQGMNRVLGSIGPAREDVSSQ